MAIYHIHQPPCVTNHTSIAAFLLTSNAVYCCGLIGYDYTITNSAVDLCSLCAFDHQENYHTFSLDELNICLSFEREMAFNMLQ